ncbi:S8 family serine peptidase [Phaeodactylibacter luteus]|uniref:S8 family serine peptidase n=2 Tax=Phaeodactylibacter luteus TaxID=1564516 RepID=A0A5C6RI17_9BACT|nr:S8 family serine peptidase [Phaeodactylibacter luteus]
MTQTEMDQIVEETLHRTNTVFYWSDASDRMLWSASVRSDSMMSLGYQPAGFENLNEVIHEIDVAAAPWSDVRQRLIDFVVSETNKEFPGLKVTAQDLVANPEEAYLPTIDIKIFSQHIIEQLRGMEEVRYIEPMGYGIATLESRSDAGCGVSAASNLNSADFTTVSPNAKIPWNFSHPTMNVPGAWSRSTGRGIKVALLDTGTSPSQSKLGGAFNSGQSSGRTLQRLGTHVSGWWWWASNDGPDDDCGHGTQMAGLIAAPRSSGGSSLGVAYNCDLRAYRATTDVIINSSSEKQGVRDALVNGANDGAVRIFSMSIGDVFFSSTVADGVRYAYNRGKLLFSAAGTSTTFTSWYGVIFPATMAETVAVTGIRDNLTQRCNTCHDGPQVDFVAVMQRASNTDRTSLTLALSGDQPAYVGGSSAATATTAGIAALVWATNPGQSRTQVMNRLKAASSNFPNRDNNFGWGTINAALAVQ